MPASPGLTGGQAWVWRGVPATLGGAYGQGAPIESPEAGGGKGEADGDEPDDQRTREART